VVCGAEPLFMTDYIACGKVVPERIADIVAGIDAGCALAGCALIGGETAEHPGLLGPDEYDVAGAATGMVRSDAVLGPDRVRDGDTVIAMASSGLHSNGYSLARHVLFTVSGLALDSTEDLGEPLGEVLLTPTRIYSKDCLSLIAAVEVHALSHVTGGGLQANLERVLPDGLRAAIDRTTWTPAPIFELIAARGNVSPTEMERTFNLGVGMVAVVPSAAADAAVTHLQARGVDAWVCGEVSRA
jgi:phosphoribosylformylglycinamidine cyclo-ligase